MADLLACPAKVNDAYTCQVRGGDGAHWTYDDLLREGDMPSLLGNYGEDPPYGRVVRKDDGLWIVALTDEEERERSQRVLAAVPSEDREGE